MALIKGMVLISRFEYLEKNAGHEAMKKFLKRIKIEAQDYARQPVIGSNSYPENSIKKIDEILLEDYFENDMQEFRRLGEWSANAFMDRFFSLYLEQKQPVEFIYQYARVRPYLVGIGEMVIKQIKKNTILVKVEYGQNIARSVCLSEQGFIDGALKLCGANKVEIIEKSCAGVKDNYFCEYQLIIE